MLEISPQRMKRSAKVELRCGEFITSREKGPVRGRRGVVYGGEWLKLTRISDTVASFYVRNETFSIVPNMILSQKRWLSSGTVRTTE